MSEYVTNGIKETQLSPQFRTLGPCEQLARYADGTLHVHPSQDPQLHSMELDMYYIYQQSSMNIILTGRVMQLIILVCNQPQQLQCTTIWHQHGNKVKSTESPGEEERNQRE